MSFIVLAALWSSVALIVALAALKFAVIVLLNSPLAVGYAQKMTAQMLSSKLHRQVRFEPGRLELSVGLSGLFAKSHNPSLMVGRHNILADSVGLAWHWGDRPMLTLQGATIPVQRLPAGDFSVAGIPLASLAGAGGQTGRLPFDFALLATDTKIVYQDAERRALLFGDMVISARSDPSAGLFHVSAHTPPGREPISFAARANFALRADNELTARLYVRASLNADALAGMLGTDLGGARARVTLWGDWERGQLKALAAFSVQDLDVSMRSVRTSVAALSGTARLRTVSAENKRLLTSSWLARMTKLQLDADEEILGTRLVLDKLEASGRLTSSPHNWVAEFSDMRMSSPDILARLDLKLGGEEGVLTSISIAAYAPRISYPLVVHLLPESLSKPAVRFLRKNLRAHEMVMTTLAVVGDPADFPWHDAGGGEFRLGVTFAGAELSYEKGWPAVLEGAGQLGLYGNRLLITVLSARVGPASVIAKAAVDNIAAVPSTLHIAAKALLHGNGLSLLLHALPATAKQAARFPGLSIAGSQAVELALTIPLDNDDQIGVRGEVITDDTVLAWTPARVTLRDLAGTFEFDRRGVHGVSRAQFMGTGVRAEAEVGEHESFFSLMGRLNLPEALASLGYTGYLPIKGISAVTVRANGGSVALSTSLAGTAVLLPPPLGKTANEQRATSASFSDNVVRIDYGGGLLRIAANRLGTAIQLGGGPPPRPPAEAGTHIRGTLDEIDLDAILRADAPAAGSFGDSTDLRMTLTNVKLLNMRHPRLDLSISLAKNTTLLAFNSEALDGNAAVGTDGAVDISIRELVFPAKENTPIAADATVITVQPGTVTGALPKLRLTMDTLRLGNRLFREISSSGRPSGDIWRLGETRTHNHGNMISLSGETAMRGSPHTVVTVAITLAQVDEFLADLGFPKVQVHAGRGTINGVLSWQGALGAPHMPSLSGLLTVEAQNLHIAKGGSVKLLRLISPFDIIGGIAELGKEGTSYDTLNGLLRISNGVIAFERMSISGSDLVIEVEGSTNIVTERHNVTGKARVTKSNNLLVLGSAAVINPLFAAAVLVLDKVFGKPLLQPVSFEYSVTGTWDDPVFKLDSQSIRPSK